MRASELIMSRLSAYSGTAQYLFDETAGICKIYPSKAAQNTQAPFVVYQLTGGDPVQSMDGPSGLAFQNVLVKSFAPEGDFDTLERLTEQVSLGLDGFTDYPNGISSVIQQREPMTLFDEEARLEFSVLEFVVGLQKPQLS